MLTTFAALLALAAFSASAAQALEWHYWTIDIGIGGGGNAFGPHIEQFAAGEVPYGSAIGCAGERGVGLNCASKTHQNEEYSTFPFTVNTEPYLHNHLTTSGNFDGLTLF